MFKCLFGTTRTLPRQEEASRAEPKISSMERLNPEEEAAISELCTSEREFNDKMRIYLKAVDTWKLENRQKLKSVWRRSRYINPRQYRILTEVPKDILRLSKRIEKLGPKEQRQERPEMVKLYEKFPYGAICTTIQSLEKKPEFVSDMKKVLKREAGRVNRKYPKDQPLMTQVDCEKGLRSFAEEFVNRGLRYKELLSEIAMHS